MHAIRHILAGLVLVVASARADVLVDFGFVGNLGTETSVAPLNTAAGLTMVANLSRSYLKGATSTTWETDGFSVRPWTDPTTVTNAVNNNMYASFGFTVNNGYKASLSAIRFGWSRQNEKARYITVMASLDGGVTGFTVDDAIDTEYVSDAATGTATLHELDLSGDARLQEIPAGTTVQIRLYHYGASNQYEGNAISSKNSQPGLDLTGTVEVAVGEEPVCAITSPANNTLYLYGAYPATIPIMVSTVDDVGVTEVRFYANGEWLGTETTDPFTHDWNWAPAQGSNCFLVAHAYDGSGNIGTSQTVRVEAGLDQPPTVAVTAPSDGTYYAEGSYPATIPITATAADDAGIAHVAFYANGTWIGTDMSSPYEVEWSWPAVPGLYTLTAVVADDTVHSVTSTPVVIEGMSQLPAGLLAYDDFTRAAVGAIHGTRSGVGWGGAWDVQGDNTAVPGFNVTSNVPLGYASLASTPGYATGGLQYLGCKRYLDMGVEGPFAGYLTSGDIGAVGSSLWCSYLYRRDGNSAQEAILGFARDVNGNDPQGTTVCRTRNAGGTWTLEHLSGGIVTNGVSSGKACVQGQASLLVLRFEFGTGGSVSNHLVSLYVDPPADTLGLAPPASPDATLVVANDGNFRFDGIHFYPGAGPQAGSFDEFRVGTSYAVVTPNALPRATLLMVR